MAEKLMLVDEDLEFLQVSSEWLEREGFEVETCASGEDAVAYFRGGRGGIQLVLLDLEMPGIDGIETFQLLREIDPELPVALCSAHSNEPAFARRVRNLPEALLRIDKPFPLVASKAFRALLAKIRHMVRDSPWAGMQPFQLPVLEFEKLGDDELSELYEAVDRVNWPAAEAMFDDRPEIDWVLMAREPGNIIDSGSGDEEPSEEDLKRTAHKLGVPVFCYSRPRHAVEELNSWSYHSESQDYYPCVTLQFHSASTAGFHSVRCHFDTGSPESYLSYEHFFGEGVVGRKVFRTRTSVPGEVWGRHYSYFKETLMGQLVDGRSGASVPVKVDGQLVVGWAASPFWENYPNRVALIGRDLLLDNNVVLVLDGKQKETRLILTEVN